MGEKLDPEFIATRIIEVAQEELKKVERFNSNFPVVYPMDKENFYLTLEHLLLIRDKAKEKGIAIQINDTDDSIKEYGTPYAFKFSKL